MMIGGERILMEPESIMAMSRFAIWKLVYELAQKEPAGTGEENVTQLFLRG
jgi:hypothetical protein